MPAVRRMKIALLVSTACNSSITGSNCSQERLALLQPAGRQIGRHAADGDVAVGQPRPAKVLEQVENLLPLAEGPHEGRETAQVQPVAAGGHQVAGDAAQLADHHPQVPRLLRQPRSPAASPPPAPSRGSCSSPAR